MLTIDTAQLKKDVEAVTKRMNKLAKDQIPFATVLAINETIERIKKNEEKQIARVFDRPTSTTKKSVYIVKAHKKRLPFMGKVGIKDVFKKGKGGMPAYKYLEPHIKGGRRHIKGSERQLRRKKLLPKNKWLAHGNDAALNKSGNITSGRYVQMLSAVRGFTGTGNRNKDKKHSKFFIILNVGIVERTGKRTTKLRLAFVSKPSYKKVFDFYGVAKKTHSRHFKKIFTRKLAHAIRTAR